MSTIRSFVFGCVSDRSQEIVRGVPRPRRQTKLKLGTPLSEAFKDDHLPDLLVDMLVYIAREGVTATDLFRRPGNPRDQKVIIQRMADGKEITFSNYNFYTLASAVKRFLLKIPGGVFGEDVERQLLQVLELDQRMEQYDAINSIITSLPESVQQLLSLLFGTWFRIVNHSEYNTMSAEAVAKSIAGSMFHTCADHPSKVESAVKILKILIEDFGVSNMFGQKNIQYFAEMTDTGIRVKERYRYEYRYPQEDEVPSITEDTYYGTARPRLGTRESGASHGDLDIPYSPPSPQSLQPHPRDFLEDNPHKPLTNVSSLSAPEVNQAYSPTADSFTNHKRKYQSASVSYESVRRRQLARMKKRSHWFLTPGQTKRHSSDAILMSRDPSVDKSSLDGTSSEGMLTESEGDGLSETPGSPRLSEGESSMVEDQEKEGALPPPPPSELQAQAASLSLAAEAVNGSHGADSSCQQKAGTEEHVAVKEGATEQEVRCFMVEHYYGAAATDGDS